MVEANVVALLLVSGASFSSTLFILIFYLVRRKVWHSFSFDLVIMLCLSDFVYSSVGVSRSIWMLIDPDASLSVAGCYIQGMIVQTSTISSFLCTTSISYALYCSVVLQRPIYREKSAFRHFWKINYLVPFLISCIVACSSYYGNVKPMSQTLCFVQGTNQAMVQIYMFLFYYLPFLVALTFDTILISRIIYHYRKKSLQTHVTSTEIAKLACYPFILFISWLPVIAFRILSFFGISSDELIAIGHISDNIIGFMDVLVYVVFSLDPLNCFNSQNNNNNDSSASFLDQSLVSQPNVRANSNEGTENALLDQDNSPERDTSKIFLKQSSYSASLSATSIT